MRCFFQTALHPERYHGHGKRPPFFEGWYYKLVDAAERNAYAIIPGVFLSDDPGKGQAFVQVFDGMTGRNTYHQYPLSAFRAARDAFEVHIGPNRFTAEEIVLQIDVPERTVLGTLRFAKQAAWPVTILSPGIMGWYAWVPFMECYHGVVSLDHVIEGSLNIDGLPTDLSGGRGYIEKDWGKSFPSAWIWLQSNHFEQPGTSLTASVAVIPWLRRSFAGFIIGLWHQGKLYRFATYTGAKIEHLSISEHQVIWVVRDKGYRLHMEANRAEGTILAGPTTIDMGRPVPQTLRATVAITLTDLREQKLLWRGTGRFSGLEVAGDLDQLFQLLPAQIVPEHVLQHT